MPSAAAEYLLASINPVSYLEGLGWEPTPWQRDVLESQSKRILLNCNRQAGKSTVTASLAWQHAKYNADALILLFAPTERQTKELMEKIMSFAKRDTELVLTEDAVTAKRLKNGSRIVALPGSERNIRGFSGPDIIVLDEASRIPDELYRAVRPMMAGADTKLVAMSTPFGKRGWWYEEWEHSSRWEKFHVTAPVRIAGTRLEFDENEAAFAEKARANGRRGYYSPRHFDFEFMLDEFDSMPEWWFRQEYLGEFMEAEDAVFRVSDIEAAFDADDVETPFQDTVEEEECVRAFDWRI